MKEIQNRISYIDALKGFAILLVVMGHTITKLYSQSFEHMLWDYPMVTMFWWLVIYSFHMPLFMFISGFLFHKDEGYSWQDGVRTIWKRAYTLLLPFLSWALITRYVFHAPWDLWFLRSLFTFVLIALLWELPRKYIVNRWILMVGDVLFYALSWWGLKHVVRLLPLEVQSIIDFRSDMYLFFCFGILFRRYKLEGLLRHRWFFTFSLLTYLVLFYCQQVAITVIPYQSIVYPLSAVMVVWYLFEHTANGDSKWWGYFVRIGKYTLEIYILHTLVSFHLPWIGDAIIQLAQSGNISMFFSASTVQLVCSMILSMVTIEISIVIRNILSKSRLLSLVLLGRKE